MGRSISKKWTNTGLLTCLVWRRTPPLSDCPTYHSLLDGSECILQPLVLTAYVGPHRDFYQLSEIPKENNERQNISFSEIGNLVHIENHLRYYNCPVIYFFNGLFSEIIWIIFWYNFLACYWFWTPNFFQNQFRLLTLATLEKLSLFWLRGSYVNKTTQQRKYHYLTCQWEFKVKEAVRLNREKNTSGQLRIGHSFAS